MLALGPIYRARKQLTCIWGPNNDAPPSPDVLIDSENFTLDMNRQSNQHAVSNLQDNLLHSAPVPDKG